MFTWEKVWLFLQPLCKTVVILLLGVLLVRLLMRLVGRGFKRTKLDPSLVKYILRAIRIALYIFVVLAALDALGVSTGGAIAAISAAAVAVGVALKDSLSNVAGGVWLLFSPRFATGDYIEAGGDEGTVIAIELLHTTLQTFDGKQVSIPNGVLVNSHITNYSVENRRRVDILFPVPYDTDMERAKKLAMDTISAHSLVITEGELAPFVRVKEYGESSVNLIMRAWCQNADYWTVQYDLTEAILLAFTQNGITVPYKQVDVHIKPEQE